MNTLDFIPVHTKSALKTKTINENNNKKVKEIFGKYLSNHIHSTLSNKNAFANNLPKLKNYIAIPR